MPPTPYNRNYRFPYETVTRRKEKTRRAGSSNFQQIQIFNLTKAKQNWKLTNEQSCCSAVSCSTSQCPVRPNLSKNLRTTQLQGICVYQSRTESCETRFENAVRDIFVGWNNKQAACQAELGLFLSVYRAAVVTHSGFCNASLQLINRICWNWILVLLLLIRCVIERH